MLKEHIAMDRTSWSLKRVWIRVLWNVYGWIYILQVVYKDPHMYR